MYSKAWFAFPVAVKLSAIYLSEDILLDGDLQDEYAPLVKDHIVFKKNKALEAKILKTYLKGSNLWGVTSDIMERFHLLPIVTIDDHGACILSFEKSQAWKRE